MKKFKPQDKAVEVTVTTKEESSPRIRPQGNLDSLNNEQYEDDRGRTQYTCDTAHIQTIKKNFNKVRE